MSSGALSFAVITPVRDEAARLPRLATSVLAQSAAPSAWIIVDDGSSDGSDRIAAELAAEHEWIHVITMTGSAAPVRGGPVVRSFTSGLYALGELSDVVVKLDADVSFEPDYFRRLVAAFAVDDSLGIASGICYEHRDGRWVPLYGTRDHVWGATRAYRRDCLRDVMPLETRQGWDEIDALKARLKGWRTQTLLDLPFRHHRALGGRDGGRRVWLDQGETAHYMGYRPTYLLARSLFRVRREPLALLMLWGYWYARWRRRPRLPDERVRRVLREQQRLRALRARAHEALGKTA